MIQLFKHNYFKYFLFVVLALKGVYLVADNIGFITDTEICYQLDADNFESEPEDQKELDESEKFNQISPILFHFDKRKATNNHIVILKKYRIQYLEFTTPPPQFV